MPELICSGIYIRSHSCLANNQTKDRMIDHLKGYYELVDENVRDISHVLSVKQSIRVDNSDQDEGYWVNLSNMINLIYQI
jgi:hypothetical protein